MRDPSEPRRLVRPANRQASEVWRPREVGRLTERKLQEARLAAMAELSQRLGGACDASDIAYHGAVLLGETLGASRVGYGTVDHDSGNLTVERDWVRDGVGSAAGVTPLLAYGSFIDSLRRGQFIATCCASAFGPWYRDESCAPQQSACP